MKTTNVEIYKNNEVVARSKNLRGILDYARKHGVRAAHILRFEDDSAIVTFYFDDDAHAAVIFASANVAFDWLKARKSWRLFTQNLRYEQNVSFVPRPPAV